MKWDGASLYFSTSCLIHHSSTTPNLFQNNTNSAEFPLVDTPPIWTFLLNGHFLPDPYIVPRFTKWGMGSIEFAIVCPSVRMHQITGCNILLSCPFHTSCLMHYRYRGALELCVHWFSLYNWPWPKAYIYEFSTPPYASQNLLMRSKIMGSSLKCLGNICCYGNAIDCYAL